MSNTSENRASSLPEQPQLYGPNGEPLDEQGRPIKMGIDWGGHKAAQGPPAEVKRPIAEWFKPIFDHLKGIVTDEGLILDLCLERAIKIVDFNHNAGMWGSDFFKGGAEGQQASLDRGSAITLAIPLAAKLYDGVIATLNKPDQEKLLKQMVADAQAKKS